MLGVKGQETDSGQPERKVIDFFPFQIWNT